MSESMKEQISTSVIKRWDDGYYKNKKKSLRKQKVEQISLICKSCKNTYLKYPSLSKNSKYCSRICKDKDRINFEVSSETIKKIIKAGTGRKQTQESKEKCRLSKLGEKNPNWKGDDIEVHNWIRRKKNKSEFCECCGEKPKYKRDLDLSNISQEYKYDVNDFEWLCRRCHMTKDGRIETFNKK